MALTETQKTTARYFLGVPDVGVEPDYEFEGAITVLSATAETRFIAVLDRLDANETAWAAGQRDAGLKRVEEIEWYQGQKNRDLNIERETLITRLATMLGIVYPRPYANNAGSMNGATLRG